MGFCKSKFTTIELKHYTLRLIIIAKGYSPRNYSRFLDYTAQRIILRKAGGSYLFIHRMLMEYFASLEAVDGDPAVNQKSTPKRE